MNTPQKDPFSDDLSHVAELLHSGGMALLPTDTFWSVCAALHHSDALHSLNLSNNTFTPHAVLVVRDIPMIRQYIIDLHPRIETLLHYHTRPLIILGKPPKYFPSWLLDHRSRLAVMISQHPFCLELIRALKGPLVSVVAFSDPQNALGGFGKISSDVIESVQYISHYGRMEELPSEDCPIISYDKKGNITFEKE